MTETQLLARDAKRDIGAELLLSVRQMKAGKGKAVATVEVLAVARMRMKSGLPQHTEAIWRKQKNGSI